MKTANNLATTSGTKLAVSIVHKSRPIWRFQLPPGLVLGLALLGISCDWAQAAPVTIWNDATVPANVAVNDPNAVQVGLKFRSAVNGDVTGIRFYKGPGNSGSHVGNLWSSTGASLGSVEFSSETDSGWQQQMLPGPVSINSNTTYVVSYHAPVGQYAADSAYFAASGVDSYPLRALANGEDGPNGVYAYGSSGTFPDQTFGAANYWVDVVFVPEQIVIIVPDTNAPTIFTPPDVILQCAECNTDPTNTGTATATDDVSSVTVTYSDVVVGDCPKTVTRTWSATDEAGNTAHSEQTISCVPPCLVITDSSGCTFDSDPTTAVSDFRLIFTPDPKNRPCVRLTASNPGQFRLNMFYTGKAGQQVTFDLTIPYPFVTQGSRPIHAYDGVSESNEGDQHCLTTGNSFYESSQQIKLSDYGNQPGASTTVPITLTVPASGAICLTVHLDYGLKKTGGYQKNADDDALDCATGTNVLIANHGSYLFSVSGAQAGSTCIQNDNSIKKNSGGGLWLHNPHMQTNSVNRFGFTITGTNDVVFIIEVSTNLANPVWHPVETNILTDGSFEFSDPQWTKYPGRIYRLRTP